MSKMSILGIVFMILSYVLGFLTPMIRNKVKKTETKFDDFIFETVLTAVTTVDQLLNGKSGESKKQRAMDLATKGLAKAGLSVSKDVLSDLVEQAVTDVRIKKAEKETEVLVPTGE